jgi:biopolymer transport protein ExbD
MNFRKRTPPQLLGFQIAPMVDVLLVLLVFFIVTWHVALSENELDVKVPAAANATPQKPYLNQVVLNIRKDGSVMLNHVPLNPAQLKERLAQLAGLYPDQAVIVRGDEQLPYKDMIAVLDICRAANIWNLIFATAIPAPSQQP